MIDLSHENLIPVLDVLKLVPVSKPTLRRWTATGKLEVVRAGARVFTSREAVARFLQQGPQPIQASALPPRRAPRHGDRVQGIMESLKQRLGGFD